MKLDKLLKKLDTVVVGEIDALDAEGLHKVVVASENNINTATKERNENSDYMKAKEVCKDFNSALNEAKNYQQAKIAYAIIRIKELNGEDLGEAGEIVTEFRNMPDEREV